MDQLFIVTKNGYEILYEKNCDFLQDEKYILIDNILIRKDQINEPAIFRGNLCVITFDFNKITKYQKMLEENNFRKN